MNAKTKGSPFKWLGAMVMSLLMVLACLPTVAFAAETTTGTLTIKDGDKATSARAYEAYQVFKARNYNSDNGTFGDLDWADDFTGQDDLVTALKGMKDGDGNAILAADATVDSIKAIADALNSKYCDLTVVADTISGKFSEGYVPATATSANHEAKFTELGVGWYLILDTTDLDGAKGEANSALMLQFVGDETVTAKSDVPVFEKKVQDNVDNGTQMTADKDDRITKEGETWTDAADYCIGDDVPFQLSAVLPTIKFDAYDTYKLVFNDTMDAGLTFKAIESVTISGTGHDDIPVTEDNYTLDESSDKHAFTLTIADVKALGAGAGDRVTVVYKSTLNQAAEVGLPGNSNEAYLQYTNNPNYTGEGDNLGKTPEDKVVVFTYELEVDKVDKEDKKLTGAGFTIKDADGQAIRWTQVGNTYVKAVPAEDGTVTGETEFRGQQLSEFLFIGLDAGEYTLEETTVPDGYNKAADQKIVISADPSSVSDDPTLSKVTIKVDTADAVEGDPQSGLVKTKVVNVKGATLPTTGGMGTTLLYAVGGALVVAAAGILIYKKVRPQEA